MTSNSERAAWVVSMLAARGQRFHLHEATFVPEDRKGIPLGHEQEAEQAKPPFIWVR